MKKFRIFMFTAVVCLSAAPFFTSCNEDDSTETPIPVDGSVAGTYKLNAYGINDEDFANPGTYIAATADLNNDGTFSHDLTAESSCFAESTIKLNANHTYSRVYSYPDGTGACVIALREAGVWSKVDNVITLTSSVTNGEPGSQGGMDVYSMDFTYSDAGTLTGSREDVDYGVGTGFGVGKIDFGYTKVAE